VSRDVPGRQPSSYALYRGKSTGTSCRLRRAARPRHRLKAACPWASGGQAALAALGAALGISGAAVREQLPVLAPRLGVCGLAIVTDGIEVRLEPLPVAAEAVGLMGRLATNRRTAALSDEAVTLFTYVG
jgi:hypothetical protein